MQTVKAEERALMVRAQQYQEALRKKLNEQLNVGGRNNADWMGGNLLTPLTPDGRPQNDGNGVRLRAGQSVTDAQLKALMAKGGGNPYLSQLADLRAKVKEARTSNLPSNRGVSRRVNQTLASQPNLIQQLAQDFQYQQDKANYENQRRYDEGHGELSSLRERNSERVKNFGIAAGDDLDERFSQNLANVTANLSSRGLGNSTITSAFDAKNARDLAREQQRLSEMVDDRASRYDSTDTRSLVDFVERRNDIGPDFSQLSQLAQLYGASGAGQQEQFAEAPVRRGTRTLEDIGYERPQMGMNVPYAVSGNVANQIQGNVANQIQGNVSGAYPSTRQMMNPLVNMGVRQSNGQNRPRNNNPEADFQRLRELAAQQERIAQRRPAYSQTPYAQNRATRLEMQRNGMAGQKIKPIPQANIRKMLDNGDKMTDWRADPYFAKNQRDGIYLNPMGGNMSDAWENSIYPAQELGYKLRGPVNYPY